MKRVGNSNLPLTLCLLLYMNYFEFIQKISEEDENRDYSK